MAAQYLQASFSKEVMALFTAILTFWHPNFLIFLAHPVCKM
jgi:hypothetical protein